jgi:hypothetical protein
MNNLFSLPLFAAIIFMIGVGWVMHYQPEEDNSIARVHFSPEARHIHANYAVEHLLAAKPQGDQVRFGYYPFSKAPIWITLQLEHNSMQILRLKQDIFPEVHRFESMTIHVDDQFINEVNKAALTYLTTAELPHQAAGLDGASWQIEVLNNGLYYSNTIWSPTSGTEYRLGKLLFAEASRYLDLGELL